MERRDSATRTEGHAPRVPREHRPPEGDAGGVHTQPHTQGVGTQREARQGRGLDRDQEHTLGPAPGHAGVRMPGVPQGEGGRGVHLHRAAEELRLRQRAQRRGFSRKREMKQIVGVA